jgi:hypothetical protein
MSLPLRITFEGKDYTYLVLTKRITRETQNIRIELEGVEYELTPNNKKEWYAADATINDNPELLKAIAKNIVHRYRL